MKSYTAPWGNSLIAISVFATLACVAAAFGIALRGELWIALTPFVVLLGGMLFIIRGYTVAADVLLVHRPCWTTRLPLVNLHSAQVVPRAMRWSIRTFGNGGLFSFTGWYYNRLLGAYRAFVTDPNRTVVLQLGRHRVVVSPSAPEDFVREILAAGMKG